MPAYRSEPTTFPHAIISKVDESAIEIIQQNVWKKTRESFNLININNLWYIESKRIIGRLSLPE